MRVVVFLDLDDTVLQTAPKCRPDWGPAEAAAVARDGSPLSFTTAKQRALLNLFAGRAEVVPTTARNLDAFRRVRLPFGGPAIIDNGGVVLRPDGTPDPEWDARVRPLAAETSEILERAGRLPPADPGVYVRVIGDFGMPLYVLAKHIGRDAAALARYADAARGDWEALGLRVHLADNNLSAVPAWLGKEHAVRFLTGKLGPALTIGAGDAAADAGFLAACDYAMSPAGSALFARLTG